MAYNIKIQSYAEEEFLESVAWYELQRNGLGDELILCFEEALEVLKRNPFFEVRYKDLRLYNIRRFPYQIIYYLVNDSIEIVAFFHAHREPKQWHNRR
jgi:hypothetical protein